jgi:predicted neutral ceramidase superfamily lipid hydrolase
MKNKLIYFVSNILIFLLILWFAKGQSGGDIFLILAYGTLTFVQIIFCIVFTKNKENVLGIIFGIILSIVLFKIIDNQQSKQETKMIDETLDIK